MRALFLVLALVVSGCTAAPAPAPRSLLATPTALPLAPVGEPQQSAEWVALVDRVESMPVLGTGPLRTQAQRGTYLLLHVSVRNQQPGAVTLDEQVVQLTDATGRRYPITGDARFALGDTDPAFRATWSPIPPQETRAYVLPYDVDPSAAPYTLHVGSLRFAVPLH